VAEQKSSTTDLPHTTVLSAVSKLPTKENCFMSTRETGTVKWFDNAKGFGFIQRQAGEDVFVHFRQVRGDGYRSLKEGQSVEFTAVKGNKGWQAEDVTPL
jgi:CspA family cold shock protein